MAVLLLELSCCRSFPNAGLVTVGTVHRWISRVRNNSKAPEAIVDLRFTVVLDLEEYPIRALKAVECLSDFLRHPRVAAVLFPSCEQLRKLTAPKRGEVLIHELTCQVRPPNWTVIASGIEGI